MEPVAYLKNVHSPLYDRRLALIILKKYSYGRRSFSESAKSPKIKQNHREGHYEPEAQTKERSLYKEAQGTPYPRVEDSHDASE
jgi:hypothetical protein